MTDIQTVRAPASGEALKVQQLMRRMVGKRSGDLPVPAFVGVLSDEIDELRRAGKSDAAIAGVIRGATGQEIDAEDIGRFHIAPERRSFERL